MKRINHLSVALILLLVLSASVCAQGKLGVKGHLRDLDGTAVLFTHGTPFEQGEAEGYLMAQQIVSGFKGFALSKSIVLMPRLWDTFLRPLIEKRMSVPKRVKQYADGVISGIKKRNAKLLHLKELDRDLNATDICSISSLPDFAGFFCSSFAALPRTPKSRSGIVIGRNLDYMASQSLLNAFVIRAHAPNGERHGWLDLGYAGLPGCLTGFSDAGTYVAIHDVFVRSNKKSQEMTPRLIALMELMETVRPTGKVADAAVKQLTAHSFAMGGNAMFAWDASSSALGACVLEFGPVVGEAPHVVARPLGPEGFIACSNHFRLRTEPSRCRRFQSIVDNLALGKALTTQNSWAVIESASVRGTLYRLVADLRSGAVELDRKMKPRASEFKARLKFNYRALLREAAQSKVTMVDQ